MEPSEKTSFKVSGQLGTQKGKRCKVDLDEIGRLRNEVELLKRQNWDKDKMVKELSDRVGLIGNEVSSTKTDMLTLFGLVQTLVHQLA